ncbi:MAG TPA: hypothetical protein VF351_08395 [Actinomycetota bacterium]
MARFALGLIVGGLLVTGIASGQGGGTAGGPASTPAPEPVWVDTPMKAASGTHLAHHGFCRRGLQVRQVGGWQSRHYRCVATRGD